MRQFYVRATDMQGKTCYLSFLAPSYRHAHQCLSQQGYRITHINSTSPQVSPPPPPVIPSPFPAPGVPQKTASDGWVIGCIWGMLALCLLASTHVVFLVAEVLTGQVFVSVTNPGTGKGLLLPAIISVGYLLMVVLRLRKRTRLLHLPAASPPSIPSNPASSPDRSIIVPPVDPVQRTLLQEQFHHIVTHPTRHQPQAWIDIMQTVLAWSAWELPYRDDPVATIVKQMESSCQFFLEHTHFYLLTLRWDPQPLGPHTVLAEYERLKDLQEISMFKIAYRGILISIHGFTEEAIQLVSEQSEQADDIIFLLFDGVHLGNTIIGAYDFQALLTYALLFREAGRGNFCPYYLDKELLFPPSSQSFLARHLKKILKHHKKR